MKKIYLDIIGKRHTLYDEIINYPPSGYEFILGKGPIHALSGRITNIDQIYSFQKNILNEVLPINLVKAFFERMEKIPEDTSLTYSSGHLIFRKEPWVVDLEFVTHLTGYKWNHFTRYKKIIERYLQSNYCKKIMPWTDAGAKTIVNTIKNEEILNKIEVVPLAVHPKQFIKKSKENTIRLLFVGSINIPNDFNIKGGKEVFKAFSYLTKKYDNLELIVRSYVPNTIAEHYKKFSNIRIIEELLPWSKLEEEFISADIFLFPSYTTPGLALLDAMSYELPVITTDVWANREMVTDGQNGFLIQKSNFIEHYDGNFIPNWSSSESLEMIRTKTDDTVTKELVDKIEILINNEALRIQMGKKGRQQIEEGRFSIQYRNKKLKAIFDEYS